MKTLTVLALAAALACPAAAALAAGPYGEAAVAIPNSEAEAVTVAVDGRGLDLSRPADAGAMLHRIASAALQACGASDFSLPEYRRAVAGSACVRQGVADAVRRLDAPGVSALYGQADTWTLAAR